MIRQLFTSAISFVTLCTFLWFLVSAGIEEDKICFTSNELTVINVTKITTCAHLYVIFEVFIRIFCSFVFPAPMVIHAIRLYVVLDMRAVKKSTTEIIVRTILIMRESESLLTFI